MSNGGGAIHLIVNGELRVDGEVSANGLGYPMANVGGNSSGGGSGGSLFIEAERTTGSGAIRAEGGRAKNGLSGSGGGGGGGRIAVYSTVPATFQGLVRADYGIGQGGGYSGRIGTIVFDHAGCAAGGTFDGLTVGTAPDCDTPAGQWAFPQAYVDWDVCEFDSLNYSIVETSSFDTGAQGNSLKLDVDASIPTDTNLHLPAILYGEILEEPNVIVVAEFRIWVASAGVGGGTVYLAGDPRGPQLTWYADGTLAAVVDTPQTIVAAYPTGVWQNVRMEVDLVTDTYDVLWSTGENPPQVIAQGLSFRNLSTMDYVGRIAIAHFGALGAAQAYFDDICVSVKAMCGDGNCNGGEDSCSCPQDCGAPDSTEVANSTCQDGLDNDCDTAVDCEDLDCVADPACTSADIPAVSTWGMIAMAILILTAGTLVFMRRQVVPPGFGG